MIQARDDDGLEESGRRSAERWSNYESRSEVEPSECAQGLGQWGGGEKERHQERGQEVGHEHLVEWSNSLSWKDGEEAVLSGKAYVFLCGMGRLYQKQQDML